MADVYPTRISGKVQLSDGSVTEFAIDPGVGWQQWGNHNNQEGSTCDLMDGLTGAAVEAGLREEDEDGGEAQDG